MKTIKIQLLDLPGPDHAVLTYCRKLLKDGEKPETRLEAYRDEMLCLIVPEIGEGAKFEANGDVFTEYRPTKNHKHRQGSDGEARTAI